MSAGSNTSRMRTPATPWLQDLVDTAGTVGIVGVAGRETICPSRRSDDATESGKALLFPSGIGPAGSPSDEAGFAVLQGDRDNRRSDGRFRDF